MHAGKNGQDGAAQNLHQTPVLRTAPNIDHHYPVIGQMVSHHLKKLLGGHVPGNVRGPIGIDADDLKRIGIIFQRPASVLDGDVQIRQVHTKIVIPSLYDVWIDFDAFNLDVGEYRAGLPAANPTIARLCTSAGVTGGVLKKGATSTSSHGPL